MAKQTNRQEAKRMDEKTIERPGYWAVLPAQVRYDPELPASAKILYAEISSLTDQTGYCYASNAYFMKLYGCADRTLQRQLKALEDRGYIRIQDGSGGSDLRKIFAGINPISQNPDKNVGVDQRVKALPPDKNVGGPPTKMSPGPDKNVGDNKKENRKENEPPKAPQGAEAEIWDPEAFERFWKLYPKKKDKAKAIREWNRLKADRKLMKTMSAALGAQMASEEWQRDNGRAIPYPCRWLSHRRWEDELEIIPDTPPIREEVRW